MNSNKLSVIFLNLFIISFPLSVTASQSFAILSIFLFLFSSYSNKNLLITLKNQSFMSAIAIYLTMIPSFFFHILQYETSLISILTKSEISDFWMCFVILPAYYHIRNPEYRSLIFRSIYLCVFLVVVSGFITIFTPFRLAVFIRDGFQVKDGVRLQHFAGDFWGRYTYLPIGLMNTHLTFGGLCGLLFPGILFHLGLTLKDRKVWKNLLFLLISILFAIVIFYNQSRSIWLGILFVIGLIGIKLFLGLKIKIRYFQVRYILVVIGILFVIVGSSLSIYKKNWLLQRAFQESFADNTTENQRYFIYKNTLSLIQNQFVLGVGPGMFRKEHNVFSDKMISENEQLWYELFITPRQHAHHDLLHFFSISGLFGLVAFLYFWFYLIRLFIKNPITSETVLFSGVLVLFIGGFFQCYLLDDEVTLPFFALIGMFAGSLQKEDKNSKSIVKILARREVIITLCILLIPIALSLIYIFYKTRLEPMQVYKRKVTLSYPEDRLLLFKSLKGDAVLFPTAHMTQKDSIRIEGCLTHRFTNPITIRKEPFQFVLKFSQSVKNPPTTVKITVKERDAFDQDQLYKVHKIRDIGGEYIFALSKKEVTKISLGGMELFESVKDSDRFPENIYFRDFVFQFSGFDPNEAYFDLPVIDFGNLCDAR